MDGLLSGRFVMAFISSGLCLVFKGVCIGFMAAEVRFGIILISDWSISAF